MQSNAAQIRGSKRKRACFSTLHGVGTIVKRAFKYFWTEVGPESNFRRSNSGLLTAQNCQPARTLLTSAWDRRTITKQRALETLYWTTRPLKMICRSLSSSRNASGAAPEFAASASQTLRDCVGQARNPKQRHIFWTLAGWPDMLPCQLGMLLARLNYAAQRRPACATSAWDRHNHETSVQHRYFWTPSSGWKNNFPMVPTQTRSSAAQVPPDQPSRSPARLLRGTTRNLKQRLTCCLD
jgi:hypothetical protein